MTHISVILASNSATVVIIPNLNLSEVDTDINHPVDYWYRNGLQEHRVPHPEKNYT